jgi:hypothetical protein
MSKHLRKAQGGSAALAIDNMLSTLLQDEHGVSWLLIDLACLDWMPCELCGATRLVTLHMAFQRCPVLQHPCWAVLTRMPGQYYVTSWTASMQSQSAESYPT